jgi:hypothetical protein
MTPSDPLAEIVKRMHPLQAICTTPTVADADARNPKMTDREKILVALREKPLKAFEIMKRVNIKASGRLPIAPIEDA